MSSLYTNDNSISIRKVITPLIVIGLYSTMLPSISKNLDLINSPLSFQTSRVTIANAESSGGTEIIEGLTNKQIHPLERFLGTWQGDDFEEMLNLVYISRSKF